MRFESIRGTMGKLLALALILAGASPLAFGQAFPNLKMGNPSGARADVTTKDNYLLDREYFATSYNNSKGTPNWVSWRLAAADLGKAPRDNFYADPDLPSGFLRVEPAEYNRSGFDRGHMCPHGDRTATPQASLATFAMTNIIPQAHNLNTKAWEALENYCRGLVQNQGKVCYIIDGPAGVGGNGKNGGAALTPDGKVTVPMQNWKVAMVLDSDVASAKDLTADSAIRLIAIIAPNDDSAVGEDWTPFQTTVSQVEALTGFQFFSEVDPAVINPLKEQRDNFNVRPVPALILGRIAPAPPEVARVIPAPQAPARVVDPRPAPEVQPMLNSPAIVALNKATEGLTYPSESDEPLDVFAWGAVQGPLTDDRLRQLAKQDPRARVERIDPELFFDRLIHPKQARGQVSPALARQFAALLSTLKTELTDVQVVKFGQSEVVIYIIGRTKDGQFVGVRTAATET